MPSFKIQKPLNFDHWGIKAEKFVSEGRIVDEKGRKIEGHYAGRRYRLEAKREKDFSLVELMGRKILGILALIFTFGACRKNSHVHDLLHKKKRTIRLGVEVSSSLQEESLAPKSKADLSDRKQDIQDSIPSKSSALKSTVDLSDPKHDISGNQWLDYYHLWSYANSVLRPNHPEMNLVDSNGNNPNNFENIRERVKTDFAQNPSGNVFVYPFYVTKNHWTLVYIDRIKRTVEYYDSFKSFGNYDEIQKSLNQVAKDLTENEPDQAPYRVENKIKKTKQKDGYQCGVWALYFLEKRLNDPSIDFNKLNIKASEIVDYRHKIMRDTIEVYKSANPKTFDAFNQFVNSSAYRASKLPAHHWKKLPLSHLVEFPLEITEGAKRSFYLLVDDKLPFHYSFVDAYITKDTPDAEFDENLNFNDCHIPFPEIPWPQDPQATLENIFSTTPGKKRILVFESTSKYPKIYEVPEGFAITRKFFKDGVISGPGRKLI